MSVGEVARRAGLRASAIRYYEEIGVLPRARRVNGRRIYDAGILERLAVVAFARRAGFTLAEVGRLFGGYRDSVPASARWRELAGRKRAEIDTLIRQARQMQRVLDQGLKCRCLSLEECGRRLLSASS